MVSFESEELNDYLELTKKIGKLILGNKKKEISDQAKMLLIKRARLVAAARQKVDALVDEMKDYMEENHILVLLRSYYHERCRLQRGKAS